MGGQVLVEDHDRVEGVGVRRQGEDDGVAGVRPQVVRVEGVEAPVLAVGADVVDQHVPGLGPGNGRRQGRANRASRRRLLRAGNATEVGERRHQDRAEDESQDHVPVPPFVFMESSSWISTICREALRKGARGRPSRMPPKMSASLSGALLTATGCGDAGDQDGG